MGVTLFKGEQGMNDKIKDFIVDIILPIFFMWALGGLIAGALLYSKDCEPKLYVSKYSLMGVGCWIMSPLKEGKK